MGLHKVLWLAIAMTFLRGPALSSAAISVAFDYTYDSGGFFADSTRKNLLQAAANEIGSRLADTLAPINPGSGNAWRATFFNPADGNETYRQDLTIAANTMVVYVGARILGSYTLAQGGFGGYSALGTAEWKSTVVIREQPGAPTSDFGPWGGSIVFNSSSINWFFGSDPTTLESFPGQYDFSPWL